LKLNTKNVVIYKSAIVNYSMVSISVLIRFSYAEDLVDNTDNAQNLH